MRVSIHLGSLHQCRNTAICNSTSFSLPKEKHSRIQVRVVLRVIFKSLIYFHGSHSKHSTIGCPGWCSSVDWEWAVNQMSPVQFPVRAHACVAGQVPSGGHMRGNHTLMFLSLSFSFPSPLSKNK